VEAFSTNAFELAVENTAVPLNSLADGIPFNCAIAAELDPDNRNRAAPALT
jgi:hypothetical protein